ANQTATSRDSESQSGDGVRHSRRQSRIAEPPTEFEDRLERVLANFTKLKVWVLEKHDLALSKAIRCTDDDDLQQIRELHHSVGLVFDVLLERFRTEVLGCIVGDPRRHRDYFLWMIEDLFGEHKKVDAERRLGR